MLNNLIADLRKEIARNELIDTQRHYDRAQIQKKQLKVLEAAQAKLDKLPEAY